MVYLQNFETVEDYEAVKDTLPQNCVVTINNNNGAIFKADPTKHSIVSTSNLKTINGESLVGEGNIVIAGGSGAGLRYAIERTVYPTKLEVEGLQPTVNDISNEERDYNKETYQLAWEKGSTFLFTNGMFFNLTIVDDSCAVYNALNHINNLHDKDGIYSSIITVTKDGDAIFTNKKVQTTGGSTTIDPEMLEGVMKHSNDFSKDFNNDF
jgi:hypothetical protein